MKRTLAIVVLLFSLATFAHADEASRRIKTTELLNLMHMDVMMDQMMTAVKAQTLQAANANGDLDGMTAEQKGVVADYQDQVMTLSIKLFGWNAVQPDIVTIYAQNFTDEEIDGMLVFYRSPIGQSVLKKMPQMTTIMIGIVQKKVAAAQPQIKVLTEEFVQKMKATKSESKESTKPVKKS